MWFEIEWTPRQKKVAASALVFLGALAWFWFWRPYGLYGGDSDLIEFHIYRGDWIRKREPLPIALFQLSHQIMTRLLGWPVGQAISFVSCLAGATAVTALWNTTRKYRYPILTLALILCSGFTLNFYGAIEVYAIPTAMLSLWILAIQRVAAGEWPNRIIPMVYVAVCLSHIFGLILFPCLLLSAYLNHSRMTARDRWTWLECVAFVPTALLVLGLWSRHEGNSLSSPLLEALAPGPGQPSFLPVWSLKHLAIKGHFLWLGTGIALPFAIWRVWWDRRGAVTLQLAAMAGMALIFLALFHPDIGYDDWDLFLFPSLPVACLAAPVVAGSSRRVALSTVWIAVFLSIWIPRIPVWAHLSERGLAEVRILNRPSDARIRLDDRYPVEGDAVWMGGGMHSLSVWRHGDRIRWKVFRVWPGDEYEIRLPVDRTPGPFAEQIERMQTEGDEETGFDGTP